MLTAKHGISEPSIHIYPQRKELEFRARLDSVARLYGVAAAMRLQTEKAVLSQVRRAPGLPSSMVGLETVLGTDETIEFEDVLNGMYVCSCITTCACIAVYSGLLLSFLCKQDRGPSPNSYRLHTYTHIDPLEKPDVPQVPVHDKMEAMLGL